MREEACSCFIILGTFWFFACMTMILGLYGSVDLVLGPNGSRPLRANSMLVQDIKVQKDDKSNVGPMLYGFHKPPSLDVTDTWLACRNVSISMEFHKEWVFNLNKGAKIYISYSLASQSLYPLILVIARGRDNFLQWIEDPSRPNTTLSWNLIHGDGTVEESITMSSDYYIAVVNLNHLEIEVILSFQIQNIVYNTSGAYYKCALNHKLCALQLFLSEANFGVLTTPIGTASESDEWYVKVSYGPRWITYFVGSGVLTVLMVLLFKIFTELCGNTIARGPTEFTTPLVPNKDDDNQSLGSSYESVSHDEDDVQECIEEEPNIRKNGEINDLQQSCTICCDAQRDCFFLPCGHCAVCFTCGTRILDEAGTCPICRRKMKKLRKIFTV